MKIEKKNHKQGILSSVLEIYIIKNIEMSLKVSSRNKTSNEQLDLKNESVNKGKEWGGVLRKCSTEGERKWEEEEVNQL